MTAYVDRIVVVTGARRGIGRVIADHFLDQGAKVIGLSRGDSTIEAERYTHVQVDVSKAEDVKTAFARISREFPSVHIVVNNAGLFTSQLSMLMSAEQARAMVETNLLGTFHVSREAAKIMRRSRYGRIINVGSIAVRTEPYGSSIYAACKAGVAALSNVMAKELAALNVTCNTLGVTFFETEMLEQFPKEQIDALVKALTIPRYATAEDICNAIDFFASEKSSYITAQTVFLGGIH